VFEKNIIAKSHFTTKADGESSFYQFVKECGITDEDLRFEYTDEFPLNKKGLTWRVASWGGYTTAGDKWMIFVSWRASKTGQIAYYRWFWDEATQSAYGKRVDTWWD
jgi:hypothetical protein